MTRHLQSTSVRNMPVRNGAGAAVDPANDTYPTRGMPVSALWACDCMRRSHGTGDFPRAPTDVHFLAIRLGTRSVKRRARKTDHEAAIAPVRDIDERIETPLHELDWVTAEIAPMDRC